MTEEARASSTYSVTSINGFRQDGLTPEQANRLAEHMREVMRCKGWSGKVYVQPTGNLPSASCHGLYTLNFDVRAA